MKNRNSPEKNNTKKFPEKDSHMIDLLEGVEKVKESEKIMTTKDFQETGEKVNKKSSIKIYCIINRKSANSEINPPLK